MVVGVGLLILAMIAGVLVWRSVKSPLVKWILTALLVAITYPFWAYFLYLVLNVGKHS